MTNGELFKNMEEELQKPEQQQSKGLFSNTEIPEPSVEDLENEMDALGYKRGHDSDSIGSMLYHTGMGVIGRTLGDIGHFAAYGGKPAGVTEKEWDETVKETGGPAALAHRVNTAIGDFGEEMGNEHQRNYTPYSPKWVMNNLGYLVPSAVQLALVKKTGMFSPNAGEKMMLEGAGNVIANAATKVPGLARYAPQIGSAAATLAENATIGAKESIPEAFMESEDAKRSFIEAAKYNGSYVPEETEREAEEVARKVLMDNIGFITATDALQNVIMDKVAGSKGSAMRKMGKAALAGAPVGFTQEAGQGIIQKEAADEPWEFTDPDIMGAGLVGAIAGSLPTGAKMGMDYVGNKYLERKQAQNIKNMGQGIDESTEAEMEAEIDGADNIRSMAGDINDNNTPPPGAAGAVIEEMAQQMEQEPAEPGTIAAVEEMYRSNGIPSFEETRETRWVLNNDSVNVENLQDITKAGIGDISTAFMELTGNPLIITSGTDGAGALHMDGTYSHGTGYKIDVSGNGLDDPDLRHAFIEYCESKGITVLDEYEHPSPNSTGGHLDLEFHGYVGNAAATPGMMAAGNEAELAQDVFNEFAVPEDAYADTNITEGPFSETREQEPLFPEETAQQQAAEPAVEAKEPDYEGTIDTTFEENLQNELNTFDRSQLIDYAKGIQNLKLRLQAGEIDVPTAIKERNTLFDDIKNNKVRTAQAPQKITAVTNDTSRAGTVNQSQTVQQNVQPVMETRQQAPQNTVPAPAVNAISAASQNAAAEERARIQRAAEQFNNDPELLRQNARQAMQWMRERVEQGEMTPDQLQANIAELEHSYRKIRERMAANRARRNRTPQSRLKSPAVKQIARRAGIKLQDVSRMAEITRNALAGKRDALKRFNVWRPEIRQAMQSIVTGTMPVNEALRSRAQTPALQASAENVPAGNIQNTQAERSIDNEQKSTQLQRENAPEGNYQNADTKLEQNQGREDTHGQTAEVKGQNLKEGNETRAAKEAASESKEAVPDKLNRLIEKEFSDGEERELANSIFIINPEDPKGEWTSWRKSYRDELNNMLAPVMKVLRSGMKQGVDIVRMEGRRDAKYNRVSNNADWYRDFYKEHKRAPKDSVEMAEKNGYITTELEDIAIDVLTGKRKDVMPEYAGTSPETRAETAKNQREIDDILYNIGLLDNIKDGVFRIADAMNEKTAGEEVKAATPVKEETTKEPAAKKKIEDFGQRIGGARKDMYARKDMFEKGEKANTAAKPKTEKKTDDGLKDRPWLRDYDIKQGENGKWTVTDKKQEEKRKQNSFMFSWYNVQKRSVEKLTFDTQEAAQKAATLDAVTQKHTVFTAGEKGKYGIFRRIGGKTNSHWFQLKDGFASNDEAMKYMAEHPEEILNMRTSYGEADLPTPEIKGWNDARTGEKVPERLKKDQNASEKMFSDTFGFRGVQFGNWNNQSERQSLMNAAYEGLLDLADVLGVDPKIISLNGELGLAFGARGHGLSGARAHYEMDYTVINLTKMKGAGSLAHEWMHALDHYLMIKGGIISNERRADGLLLAKNFNEHASDSDFQLKRSSLSDDLKQAFLKVKNTAFYKEVIETKDETDALKWEQQARERLDKELSDIRNYLAKERKYSSKKQPATEEQLKRFDELATKLAAADEKREWDGNYMTHVYPTMRKLSDLFKEITGRGLLKKNPGDDYKRLNYAISNLQVRRETLADAQAKTEFTKRVPSEYSRNNTTIDRGRSTEYWTKPTEMLARAFSSFVEDSAEAKGYTTDFLSYGSDNRLLLFGKPFPEGEERKAINQAFRDFFKVVQKEIAQTKKETGEIKFSIRAAAETSTFDNITPAEQKRQIRAKEELEKSKPVADITIKENDGLTPKERIQKAKDLYRELYQTKGENGQGKPGVIVNKYGEEIIIAMSRFDEMKRHSADKRILSLVPHIGKIIKESTFLYSEPPYLFRQKAADAFTKEYKHYGCKVNFDGSPVYARTTVRVATDGKYYYDINLDNFEIETKKEGLSQLAAPGHKPGGAMENPSLSANILSNWFGKVNEWAGDPALAETEETRKESLAEAAISQSGEQIQRAVDDVVKEVKEAFTGATDVAVDGTDVTFTMPNGLKMRVKIKEQIIVSEGQASKAKAEHGMNAESKIVVEGSAKTIDNGSLVELSQESSEGTAYHEAFHTVWDWVLNDKEKAVMNKYYGEKAKGTKASAKELMADGYKEWKRARAKGSGTILGKLYQKIQDFAYAAKAVLTRTENVHNVFRKIETGDVWSRAAQNPSAGTGEINYSIREKAAEKIDELSTPVKKQYGNETTAFGRVTQVISGKTEKNMFQKGMDAVNDLYFQMIDEDTHAHKVDKAIEKKTGKKLSADENFYNMVRENGSISKGHAKAMIDGTQDHLETIQSRIRNKYLKEQFNVNATLKSMMENIDPKKMNEKYKDFLKNRNLRDWQQALDTYLAACRLKEMHALSVAEYNEKHKKWREKKDRALKAGKEFTEKEPRLYRLPGKLTIADINAAIKSAPPELEKAAQVYYAFNKNLTILLADAGLLPPKLYHTLNEKYKRYCPLMRDFSDTAAAEDFIQGLARGNDSVVNVSNPLKEILESGSKRNLLSPLESTIKACAVYCDRAERNKVGQKAVKLAQEYKLDDLIWRVDGKHSADPKNCIFTVMINGEKVAYQCIQELYEPIVGAPEAVADMMFELAAVPARWLRTGATISPTFAIRNMIRDTIFAGIASKNGFIPVYDTVRGFMALRRNPKLRAQFETMGVSMQTFYGSEYAASAKMDELQVKEPETLYEWVKEILKKPKEGLEWFSEMSEQSTRMGEFMRAIAKGKSLEEAARDSRNLTIDFSRHGRTGKRLNQIIPFFNACMQGGDMMVRLLKNDPAGTLLKLGAYIMLPSLACWAWNRDEDWYKDLDPDLKNSYWFVNTPAGIVRIPKPQEAGVLFGSGLEAMLELATERDPDAMKNWRQAFKSAIAPNYLVTVIGPLLENAFNYSTFRGKPIVGRANEKKPAAMQYTRGTSELSKMIGGSAPVKAVWDKEGYSPSKIDNLVRGYTGTMGILLWQWTGEALNAMRGIEDQSPAKKWNERPFVREFFVNSYGLSRPMNDFYDLANEAEKAHTAHGKIGKPSPAVVDIRKTKTQIANTRKEIYKIMDDRSLTPERKRELIDVRQEKINRIAKGALKKYQGKF